MRRLWLQALVLVATAGVLLACAKPQAPVQEATATAAPARTTPAAKPQTPRPVAAATPVTKQPAAPKPVSGAPFYEGKTVEIVVDAPAGGGTDAVARIIGGIIPRYIPGTPKIVIRNQPGAGGVVANNIFTEKAKPDGLTLIQNDSSPFSMQQRRREMVKYDLTKYRNVGNITRGESILMMRKGQMGRLTDARAKPLFVGTKEGEETWQAMNLWGKEFLGWNLRWIPGYPGTAEMELAIRRGEIDLFATSNAFVVRRLLQEGVVDPVSVVGSFKDGKFQRRVDFPDVPSFEEVLGDKKPGGLPWQAYFAWIGSSQVDKSLSAPAGTPDNVMSILTEALARTSKDPEFDSMVKKLISEVYSVSVGKETDELVKRVIIIPPEAFGYITELQNKSGILSK